MIRLTRRVAPPVGPASDFSTQLRRQLGSAVIRQLSRVTLTIASVSIVGLASSSWAAQPTAHGKQQKSQPKQSRRVVSSDHHVGYASFYANYFSGRKMADGTPMRPESDNAASLTLPLGSKAMVTNLLNGRTALVTIRDRGPFIKGRIIDVSPSTAKLLGILHIGVAKVAVIPLHKLDPEKKLDAIIAAADATDSQPGDTSP